MYVCIYIYVYIYIHMYIYTYTYVYICAHKLFKIRIFWWKIGRLHQKPNGYLFNHHVHIDHSMWIRFHMCRSLSLSKLSQESIRICFTSWIWPFTAICMQVPSWSTRMMPLFFREGAGMSGSNVCTKCTFNGAVKTDPGLSLDLHLVPFREIEIATP